MPFGLPNVTVAQVFRVIQTITVPLILAFFAREITKRFSSDEPAHTKNPSLYSPLLQDIGFRADAIYPEAFTVDSPAFKDFERVPAIRAASTGRPDTTAVVLNWARFPNVLLITSMLCSPELEDIIAQVLIWNNYPRPLSYEVCQGPVTIRSSPLLTRHAMVDRISRTRVVRPGRSTLSTLMEMYFFKAAILAVPGQIPHIVLSKCVYRVELRSCTRLMTQI